MGNLFKITINKGMPIYEIITKSGACEDFVITAIHETGHLLSAIRLGLSPGVTTIVRNEDAGRAGGSEYEETLLRGDVSDHEVIATGLPRKEGIHSMAGVAALRLMGIFDLDSLQGADSDIEGAARLLGDMSIEDYINEALDLLRSGTNPLALQLLAEQLLLHKTIGSGYAEQIVSVADGETTMEETLEAIELWGERFILD